MRKTSIKLIVTNLPKIRIPRRVPWHFPKENQASVVFLHQNQTFTLNSDAN